MVSGIVSIPSYKGPVSFTVTGTNTLAYAERFALALNNALTAGTLGYDNLSTPSASVPGYTSNPHPSVIEEEISSTSVNGGKYTLPADTAVGGVYTFVTANGPVDITGSGKGDDVLVAGINSATRYFDVGGNNLITFVDGNNTYFGDTASSAGSDGIYAGSGLDSIYTGAGSATVDSGTGDAMIDLRDTKVAGATADPKSTNPADYNQFVYLDDGQNTVYANGVADVVVSTAAPNSITGAGQEIFGGSGTDLIALVPPKGATSSTGDDTVVAGSGTTSVYDDSNHNIVWGSSGSLVVDFGDSVEGSVVAGTGHNAFYGASGDTIDIFTTPSTGSAYFIVGSGTNESVNASNSAGSLTVVLGTGNETLTGGTGATTFNANYDSATGLTGTITINDFGGSDVFDFVGYTAAQYQAALASGTTTSSGYQITLSDNTKVLFTGISSITGHTSNT